MTEGNISGVVGYEGPTVRTVPEVILGELNVIRADYKTYQRRIQELQIEIGKYERLSKGRRERILSLKRKYEELTGEKA